MFSHSQTAILVALCIFCAQCQHCSVSSYREYLQRWNKSEASSEAEFNIRMNKYCSKLQEIQEINSQGLGYTLKENNFMDLLDTELNQILSAKKPQSDEGIRVANVVIPENYRSVGNSSVTAVPIDYRNKGKVTSVKNQGSCGSCWAFTSIALYESYLLVKEKDEYDLSQQFVLECVNPIINNGYESSCLGGYTDFSIQLLAENGAPLDSTYPYLAAAYGTNAGVPTTGGSSNICDLSQDLIYYDTMPGVENATNLTRYDNITADEVHILLQDSPVAALIYADSGLQSYSSGTYSGCPDFATSYANINHAVVIVGYDSNGDYIIKNSWGTAWGESGYATISKTNDCGMTAFVYQLTWGYRVGALTLFTLLLLALLL